MLVNMYVLRLNISIQQPGSNGCQSYLAGYFCWDNLICILQISYEKKSLSVTSPLPTLSKYAHKSVVPLDVFSQICATRLASAFTGHSNIFPSNAPWCTHSHLNKFPCSLMHNIAVTPDNRSWLLVLIGRGERKPQVLLSLKNVILSSKKCWVLSCSQPPPTPSPDASTQPINLGCPMINYFAVVSSCTDSFSSVLQSRNSWFGAG